jgi:hypothetical protein
MPVVDEAAKAVNVTGIPENGDRLDEVSAMVVGAFSIVRSPESPASLTV